MEESEFISEKIQSLREEIAKVPAVFARAGRDCKREIESLCEESGILGVVQKKEEELKTYQKQLQSHADQLTGQIKALEELFKEFYFAPIPEGVTHMYGLELAKLDPETRLRVMHGQSEEDPSWIETVSVLGGNPDRRDWDGTPDDIIDEGFTFSPHPHPQMASSAPLVEWPTPATHSSQDLDSPGDPKQEEEL